jgi:hypothetical protein
VKKLLLLQMRRLGRLTLSLSVVAVSSGRVLPADLLEQFPNACEQLDWRIRFEGKPIASRLIGVSVRHDWPYALVQAGVKRIVDAGEMLLSKSRPGATRSCAAGHGSVKVNTVKSLSRIFGAVHTLRGACVAWGLTNRSRSLLRACGTVA